MEEAIIKIHKQFSYVPKVHNTDALASHKQFILCGMGGSHLSAGILKMWKPGINLYVHKDYDLPPYDESFLEDSLLIASSYSGNTEEVLSFTEAALERGLSVAVITTGGALLELAKKHHLPYIQMPNDTVQPRTALGYSLIAIATFVNEPGCVSDVHRLGETFRAEMYRSFGEDIANEIGDALPVVYTSSANLNIAYNWKITFNETGKIPAFYNIFPEVNHNEMQGYDEYNHPVHFIMLRDTADHSRVQKRMSITADMLEERGYNVTTLLLPGNTLLEKVFISLAIADWTALSVAEAKNSDPVAVPMIESFKHELKDAYNDRFIDGNTLI